MMPGPRPRLRVTASLVAMLVVVGAVGAVAQPEPPRRDTVLPGLDPIELLVDPSEPWYEQAVATLERVRPSFVVVQNAEHLGWSPLSGFIIGPNHVVTAHLKELRPGEEPPRFRIRFTDGQVRESVQVAAWNEHDFGVLLLDRPVDLPPVEFGDERTLRRGDVLLNIGNPAAAERTGLAVMTAASFLEIRSGRMRTDVSTSSGGSGSPVFDLDGRVVMMSSRGFDIAVVAIDQMKVSELALRNGVPMDNGGGSSGASGRTMDRLTAEYQR
jgi:S1-C subfamily serine protease